MDTSERWQKVKEILYAALEVDPAVRPAFLADQCGSDDELRRGHPEKHCNRVIGAEKRGNNGEVCNYYVTLMTVLHCDYAFGQTKFR